MISQETTAAIEKLQGMNNNSNNRYSKANDTCLDSTIDQQTNKSWWGGGVAASVIRPNHPMTDNRETSVDKITGFIAHLPPVSDVLRHDRVQM